MGARYSTTTKCVSDFPIYGKLALIEVFIG